IRSADLPRLPEPPDEAVRSAIARLLGSRPVTVARVTSGGTTPVYRVGLGDETLYFRVAESLENDLAPELHVHETLRERGCQVARGMASSPIDPDIGRTRGRSGRDSGRAGQLAPSSGP